MYFYKNTLSSITMTDTNDISSKKCEKITFCFYYMHKITMYFYQNLKILEQNYSMPMIFL